MTARPELLPSGAYRARTYNVHTKRKGPSKTFRGPTAEAEGYAWACATEAAMDRKIREHGIEIIRRDVPTFAAFVASWRDTGKISSKRTTAAHLKQAAKVWADVKITDVTITMVRAMLNEMEERNLADRTRALRITALRKIFNAAVEDGVRSDNPAQFVKPPRNIADTAKHRPITEAELEKILAHMPKWTHAAVLISRDSGLRIGEVCGLPYYRLDLLRGRVTVSDVVQCDGSIRNTPKGGEAVTVPLTPRTTAALRKHMQSWPGAPEDTVFFNPRGYTRNDGKPLSPQTLRQYWNRAVAAAGIAYPAPRWHDLRHSCAQHLADEGVPIHIIQGILRHASITTTRKYIGKVPVTEMERWMAHANGAPALKAV